MLLHIGKRFYYHCVDAQREFCCSVNPATGREAWVSQLEPAVAKRKVAVVGAGVAGMNAAFTAARIVSCIAANVGTLISPILFTGGGNLLFDDFRKRILILFCAFSY